MRESIGLALGVEVGLAAVSSQLLVRVILHIRLGTIQETAVVVKRVVIVSFRILIICGSGGVLQ